ncbi:hypothetical protein M440DRAFT_1040237, partial [Trichoderma longibrachiatum ATCC 18648]
MQYYVFQQSPVMALPSPQVLTIQYPPVQPVVPLTMTMVSPSPIFVVSPTASSPQPSWATPVLPPGAPEGRASSSSFSEGRASSSSSEGGLKMRIVFYGHADKHNLTDVFWSKDDLPSRDAFLASLGKFAAQHHKIAITHARGRIDPAKVRVYVLPGGSLAKEEGELCGLKVEKGVEGLVTTGDVVRVLNGVDVDEGVWRG